jgi:hypothetical protein
MLSREHPISKVRNRSGIAHCLDMTCDADVKTWALLTSAQGIIDKSIGSPAASRELA